MSARTPIADKGGVQSDCPPSANSGHPSFANRSRDFFQIPAGQITLLIAATTVVLIFAWGYIVQTRGKRLGCSENAIAGLSPAESIEA